MIRRRALLLLALSALVISCAQRGTQTLESTGEEWSCKDPMFIHGSGGTGDKTEEEAKKRAVLLLTNVASAFPASLEEAENAVLSSSGADRYAEDSGKLIIDGTVVAKFSVEKQEDGTYTVSDVTTCAPSVASTEPTPNP